MKLLKPLAGLHPLWPQNKWLRTPWSTDWMHTRQDRWIQTELVFTLAKNAAKPNLFEIILLQTKTKENNWKTEETLARAVVILETERIKGSNPWCLWWWWRILSWSRFKFRYVHSHGGSEEISGSPLSEFEPVRVQSECSSLLFCY
jgi:hypothetical protein